MKPQTIICIGRSGSGKGTQIKLLEEHFKKEHADSKIVHIETGNYFRSFIEEKTVTATLARQTYLEGSREPEFLAIRMWGNALCEEYDEKKHLIFDGAPRSLIEAKIIEDALRFYRRFDGEGFSKPKVIYLDVTHDWSVARMHERGRADDQTIAQLELRSTWFETEVMPAIEFFRNDSSFDFIHIKGEQSIEGVHQDILSHFSA